VRPRKVTIDGVSILNITMSVSSSSNPALTQGDKIVNTWRLLVLKSDRLYLETVCGLLKAAFAGSIVIGVCSLTEAQLVLEQAPVDLLLSGLTAVGDEPMRVLRDWRTRGWARSIVVVSGRKEPQVLLDAMALPVGGIFDSRYEGLDALVAAARQVLAGGKYFSASTQQVLAKLTESGERLDRVLTPAEQRVFAVIGGEGLDDGEAAERLKLSRHTVRKHRESLHRKLAVSNKRELMDAAAGWGLGRTGSRVPFDDKRKRST
jgi:DNA-binding NarL/FixJ family response regulator